MRAANPLTVKGYAERGRLFRPLSAFFEWTAPHNPPFTGRIHPIFIHGETRLWYHEGKRSASEGMMG